MEGEANRPANPHLAPNGTDQPTAPATTRKDISNECTERTDPGISRTRQVESPSHQHAPSVRPRTPAPSVPHAETGSSPRSGGGSEPPGESAPGAERYGPTDSAEKSATNSGMRRAEQVISGLTPGPAANATRGPPRRAERRPPPSPRRAVHLGPIDTERNAIRRRYARAPAAHRDEHLDEPTERTGPRILGTNQVEDTHSPPRTECPPYRPGAECCARGNPLVSITGTAVTVAPSNGTRRGPSRIQTGQRAHRHAVTYAPSGNIEKTTRLTRRAADPAGGRRAHHDFETVRRNADRIRHAPRRTSSRTRRAYRPQNLSSPQNASPLETRADHPGPVDQRSSPHTQTRITRPDQPAPSVPAPETRPPKKIGHPGNKRPESGVQECTAQRVAPLCAGAAISCSEHSTLTVPTR